MRFGSLFTGAGMFDLGLERAGLECRWQVEIDPSARNVLEHHWPSVKRLQDVTKVRKCDLEPVQLVVGGFPCQDVSVAGRRAGLAGKRSGLWSEFRRVIRLLRPTWVLIENVPGLLSSNGGKDFGTILGALGQLRYGFAYRVLDGQFFGVPQRRRRVFIVGCLGDWRRAAEVLFERESSPWDSPPSREAGQRVADPITRSFAKHGGASGGKDSYPRNTVVSLDAHMGMGGPDDNAAQAGHLIAQDSGGSHWREGMPSLARDDDNGTNQVVYPCLRSNMHNNSDAGMEAQMLVTHSLSAEGADASEDGTGRGTPLVAVGVSANQRGELRERPVHGSLNGTKSGKQFDGVAVYAIQERAVSENVDAGPQGKGYQEGTAYTLEARHHQQSVANRSGVRRLTPRECERLQGLPDDWTLPAGSDSARYRLIGNGGVVNVLTWIGERILSASA